MRIGLPEWLEHEYNRALFLPKLFYIIPQSIDLLCEIAYFRDICSTREAYAYFIISTE